MEEKTVAKLMVAILVIVWGAMLIGMWQHGEVTKACYEAAKVNTNLICDK